MTTIECADLLDLAPELAAGIVCGEERAAAIDHLASCPSCQQVVSSYTTVTDRLLLLSRRVEPPAGFEQRVLAALPTERPRERWAARPRRRWMRLAAAAAALLLTFAAGALLVAVGLRSDPAFAAAEMRTAGGDVVGEVLLREDGPTSVFMSLPGWSAQLARYGPSNASFSVRIVTNDGRVTTQPVTLGGDSTWAATVDLDVDAVTDVSIIDGRGSLWCQAHFG
jgi:hypothetical protein